MHPHRRTYTTRIEATPEALLEWHASPGAFDRLAPPWSRIRPIESQGTIFPGDRRRFHVSAFGPLGFDWSLEHAALGDGSGFRDVQVAGPFHSWQHEHRFIPHENGTTLLEDRLEYTLPAGSVGDLLADGLVKGELDRLFALRHQRTKLDLARSARYWNPQYRRIAVTGASGLVGRRLVPFLRALGYDVVRLVRDAPAGSDAIRWNPDRGEIDREALEGVDAVIHLAGVSIAGGLWTRKRKAAIHDSRVNGTRFLATTLASLRRPPRVLVSTSAVGFYGNAGDAVLTEASPQGTGFLAGVCAAWESAADAARGAGIRVVHPRFGVVLAGEGGSLPVMMKPFQLGFGGAVGDGKQYFSWVALDDLIGILLEAVEHEGLDGAVNATAPEPVSNRQFGKTLGHVLHRPSVVPAPAPMMRLILGQLADELLLASQRVMPCRLQDAGFRFGYPTLEEALRHELGRFRPEDIPDSGS